MLKQIDKIFRLWLENEGAGGQLLVTYKGKTLIDRCYGYANIETKTPITQDSVFHVASISKQVTAMTVLMLHEQGKLNVYDDVRKYIPDLIGFSEPLTIKQMMNHVSGISDHYSLFYLQGRSEDDHVLQPEILRLIARQKTLNYTPGEEFMYSNPNYVLMAVIVERLTGMLFPQWAKENIFEPLGMEDTFIRSDPGMIIPNRVSSYHDNGYRYRNAVLNLAMYGSTGLNTTCRDLTKLMQQYQTPTLISRETMENIMFHVPEVKRGSTIYGGGLRFEEMEGHRYIHHGGVNAGFRTFGVLFPDDDLIVTVFANTYNIPIETAGRDVARVVLGLPPRKPADLSAYRTEEVDMDSIAGNYYCEANGLNYGIHVEKGTVYKWGVPLVHEGGNLFRQGRLDVTFAFGEHPAIHDNGTVMPLRKLTEPVPEAYAKQCVGTYYADAVQSIYTIVYENGRLYMEHLRHGRIALCWMGGDKFAASWQTICFTKDEAGKVNGYLYSVNQMRNMPFVKVK